MNKRKPFSFLVLMAVLVLAGCRAGPAPVEEMEALETPKIMITLPSVTPTKTPTWLPSLTPTPLPSFTPTRTHLL